LIKINIEKKWQYAFSNIIFKKIKKIHKKKKIVNLYITGGYTSKFIYFYLRKKLQNYNKNINIFITDERLINKKSLQNSFNVMSIFKKFKNENHNYFLFEQNDDASIVKKNYAKLAKKPDLIILTLGDDGHIASIFPHQNYNSADNSKFLITKKEDENFKRISISLNYIKKSKYIFMIIQGKQKVSIFNQLQQGKGKNFPASKIINRSICLIKK
jgi:6-phosphogluconolactonase